MCRLWLAFEVCSFCRKSHFCGVLRFMRYAGGVKIWLRRESARGVSFELGRTLMVKAIRYAVRYDVGAGAPSLRPWRI